AIQGSPASPGTTSSGSPPTGRTRSPGQARNSTPGPGAAHRGCSICWARAIRVSIVKVEVPGEMSGDIYTEERPETVGQLRQVSDSHFDTPLSCTWKFAANTMERRHLSLIADMSRETTSGIAAPIYKALIHLGVELKTAH
ncbi:unnamed protein product, partial [Mycena citricolor]